MVVVEDSNIRPHKGTYLIATVCLYFVAGMALKFVKTWHPDMEFNLPGG